MRAAAVIIGVFAAGVAIASATPQQIPRSEQVFRGATDAVTVDVSVRRGGAPIEGLKPEDFEVLDNGVRQHVDSIESTDATTLPVDVTILVDTNDEVADETDGINKQVARIAAMLRPIDRLRVWGLNPWIEEERPLTTMRANAVIPTVSAGGLVAVNDAIAAALMEPVAPDARHLIIAITNGIDTESVLRLDALKTIAEKSNATLHIAQIDVTEIIKLTTYASGAGSVLWRTAAEALRESACSRAYRCEPTHSFFQQHYTPAFGENRFDPLAAIADQTGGKLHTLGLFVEHNATDVFTNAFKDYQQNYVLRYVPQGVARAGWHAISVSIPAHTGYTVHARRGYSMDDGGSSTAPVPGISEPAITMPAAPAADVATRTVQAYERGDYAAVAALTQSPSDLDDAIRGLRALGNLWPAGPHREAVLALDLAASAFLDPATVAAQDAGPWLGDESRWLRSPAGPSEFEHDWLVAELALLEGLRDPAVARPLMDIVLKRFPGDAQFELAAAILADQEWVAGGSPADGLMPLVERYDGLSKQTKAPEVAAEARLRSAWALHAGHQDREALTRLDAMTDSDADADLKYLRRLVRSEILLTLDRAGDAVDAARAAIALLPSAGSGHEALERALLVSGDAAAARADTLTARAFDPETDPGSRFDQGSYRQFPQLLDRLRAAVR